MRNDKGLEIIRKINNQNNFKNNIVFFHYLKHIK